MRKRLTDALIRKINPPADHNQRLEVWDVDLPGFGIRVWKSSKQPDGIARSFFIMFRDSTGRQRRYKIGSYYQTSLKQARETARERFADLEAGKDITKARKHPAANTFEAVAREFVERYSKPRKRSWREDERIIKFDLLDPEKQSRSWRETPIESITRADIIDVLDRVIDRGSSYAANRLLSLLRKLFDWCIGRGYLDSSPVSGVKAPAREYRRERVLNDDEITAVWEGFDAIGYPYGPMFKLLLITAARRDEVTRMEWSEIDHKNKMWTIPRGKTKADREHQIPLSRLAIEVIELLPETGSYLFSGGRKTPVSGSSAAKKRVDKLSGVSDWRIHDLRRTAGTNLARLGQPVHVIGRVLNHAESGVTSIYDRYSYEKEKRQALNLWSEKLSGIITDNTAEVVALHKVEK